MSGFIPASLGRVLEGLRDPWLVVCALLLIIVSLRYLTNSGFRDRVDDLLVLRTPTPVKRWLGALLVLIPGTLILLTVYFVEITSAVGLQPPYVAAQQKRLELMGSAQTRKTQTPSRRPVSRRSHTDPKASAAGTKKQNNRRSSITAKSTRGSTKKSQVAQTHKRAPVQTASAKRPLRKQTKPRVQPDSWLTKGNQIAAPSLSDLDVALQFLADDDDEGFRILESTNRVVILKENLRVFITAYDYVNGKVKIRLQGTKMELWTFREALKKG